MGLPLVHPASWTSYLVCCAILAQLNRTWYLWYPPRVVAPACNPSKSPLCFLFCFPFLPFLFNFFHSTMEYNSLQFVRHDEG